VHTISKNKIGLSIREEEEIATQSASNSWYNENKKQMKTSKTKFMAKETRT
jgi:hypothetical protein